MKKILLLLLSSLLGWLMPTSLLAQLTEGTYYFYNVGADRYLNYGGEDNYTACLKPHGEPLVLAASGDGFTVQTALDSRFLSSTATSENAHKSTGTVFTFTKQTDGTYTISSSAGYMGYGGTIASNLAGTVVQMNLGDGTSDNAHWQILTKDDLLARLSEASPTNPVDATFLVTCPNFDRHHKNLSAWSDYTTGNNVGYLCNNAGYKFDANTTVKQTLSGVPNGIYLLKAQAFYRHGANSTATGFTEETMPLHGVMFAGEDQVLVKSILSTENRASDDIYGTYGRSFGGGYIPYGANNNYAGACIAFDHGLFAGNELQTTVADGSLTIGFKIDELTQYSWIAYDNIELYYLGPVQDLTPLKEQYYALRTKINEEIIGQTDAYTDNDGATTAFTTVLDTQNDIVENAMTAQEITDAKTALWAAALAFMKTVDIVGTGFDLTSFMVNPEVDHASGNNTTATGWTTTANLDFGNYHITQFVGGAPFDMHQIVANMPAGTYMLKAHGFYRPGSFSATDMTTVSTTDVPLMIYLNETQKALKNICVDGLASSPGKGATTVVNGETIYIPNSRSHVQAFYDAGCYWNEMKAVTAEDGDLTIGLKYDTFVSGGWGVISDFQLYYLGENDLSVWEEQLALVVNEAQELDLPTAPKQALSDVIQQYNGTYSTAEEYQNAIDKINEAKDAAMPYVEPYAWFKTMRTKIQENLISQTSVYTDEGNAAGVYNTSLTPIETNVENVSSVAALETETTNLWNAAFAFLKSVTINEGQSFDLTWLIQDAEFNDAEYTKYWKETLTSSTTKGVVGGDNKVMRYYNCNFDLGQTLPYTLPAGAYRMKVDGFERTNDPMDAAYTDYAAGSSVVTGVIYLNNNEQTVMNLFDVQSVTSDIMGGLQPTGASFYIANGSGAASQYISAGLYPNELIAVMPEDGEATIGYRCANTVAWTVVDNFRLEYIGEVPTEEITVTPGELTPLLAPFTINANDEQVTELYAIGSVDENKVAQLYPISSVAPGVPCVAKLNTATLSGSIEATTCRSYLLPWEGGTLVPDKENNTWKYVNEQNVEQTVTFNVLDWNDMSFNVNIENLAARRFLNNVTYTSADDASQVSKFNVAPPVRRDIPNAVMIPVPPFTGEQATVSLTSGNEAIATTQVAQGETEAYFYNLLPNKQFDYSIQDGGNVVSQGHITTKGNLRMVYAPSAYNIRDFGGWMTEDGLRTNYGHIFRGSTLNGYAKATAEDLQTLRDLGVGGEIDLRWKEDYDKDSGCGTSAFGFTLDEDYYFAAANDFTAANLSEEATQQRLKAEFEFILNHFRDGKGVYFHCAWGADRTGMLAFLLEGVLGLTLDQIYKDYELTSFSAAPGATNRLKSAFQDRIDVIQALEGETLRDKFENYFINNLGVSADDIAYFRSVMLSDNSTVMIELFDDDSEKAEGEKNTDIIAEAATEGKTVNVKLSGRTLLKDGGWNTICLPFKLSAEQLADEDCPLYGATIMTLSTATFSNGNLAVDFEDVTEMEAGKPYIVKWEGDGLDDIDNPVFHDVTITSEEPVDVEGEAANFHGIFSSFATGGPLSTMLYFGDNNELYYPGTDMTINAFRAFFTLNGDHPIAMTIELLDDDSSMEEGKKNADIIAEAKEEGKTVNVTLSGRTLYKDDGWNTLCLPFKLSAEQLADEDCPLYGATIMTLSTATFSNGTLNMNFIDATEMEAGKPYIVKWAYDGSPDIDDPVFKGVTISCTEPVDIECEAANFHGLFSPYSTGGPIYNMLYLGADNTPYYPAVNMTINAFRAYFILNGDLTVGADGGVNAFAMNFGEEATSIEHLPFTIDHEADAYYDLSGRKLSGKPTQKGIYINNGKKVVIK